MTIVIVTSTVNYSSSELEIVEKKNVLKKIILEPGTNGWDPTGQKSVFRIIDTDVSGNSIVLMNIQSMHDRDPDGMATDCFISFMSVGNGFTILCTGTYFPSQRAELHYTILNLPIGQPGTVDHVYEKILKKLDEIDSKLNTTNN
ncbi:MAG: hypothetical protein ACPKPY_09585 [Nitrososphaeraceae archaeon]